MNIDEIKYALKNVTHRKMRSWLTILSILIGIMAIYALVSFGLGITHYMNVLAEEQGTDLLYIQARSSGMPGMDENFFFSTDDLDFVSKIKGVKEIEGMYIKAGEIRENKQTNPMTMIHFFFAFILFPPFLHQVFIVT